MMCQEWVRVTDKCASEDAKLLLVGNKLDGKTDKVIEMRQCRFIGCNKCPTLLGGIDNGEREYMRNLYAFNCFPCELEKRSKD